MNLEGHINSRPSESLLEWLTKADEFERDNPTPLDNPNNTDDIDSQPVVGRRTKLKVTSGQLSSDLNRILDTRQKAVSSLLNFAWTQNSLSIKSDDIRSAIAQGVIPDTWVNRWSQAYTTAINDKLAPIWRNTLSDGVSRMTTALSSFGELEFGLIDDRISRWIDQRGGELIRDLSEAQRRAINNLITRHTIQEPLGSRTLARLIRPAIGLTQREASSLGRILDKMLRDGVKESLAVKRIDAEAARLKRQRAKRIARTELAFAYNHGTLMAVREAQAQGLLGTDIVIKVWFTQQDERVCPFCGPLHNVEVGIASTFPGKTQAMPNVLAPPAHPMCRCVLLYETVSIE